MAIKWLFFSKKIARFAQQQKASPQSLHSGNLFSCTQFLQPTTFKIAIIGFLKNKHNKMQQLPQNTF